MDQTLVYDIHQYPHNHVFRKKIATLSFRKDLNKLHRAPSHLSHQVIFAVKQLRMDELTEELYAVSDPSSPKYGKHWTKAQVAEFTKNEEGYNRIKEYLDRFGIKVVSETLHGEYITAEASVGEWESFFKTEFYEYSIDRPRSKPRGSIDSYADYDVEKARSEMKVIRTEEYSLPGEIADDLHAAFNTIHFPQLFAPRLKRGDEPSKNKEESQKINKNLRSAGVGIIPGYVTPEFINQYYGVKNNTGGSVVTQAVFASLNEGFSPNDLTYFQNYFGLPVEPIADEVGGHVSNNACNAAYFDDCVESHLDVQYMMGVASGVPTTYWYEDTTPFGGIDWISWVVAVANKPNPQDVFSISYAGYEFGMDQDEVSAFNREAIKLGTMGTTILAASGDDGAVGFLARDDSRYCAYMPMFPASSPYVTAVGGTNGPQKGSQEESCLSTKNFGVITSGGGFSYYCKQPSFQSKFINDYFNQVNGKSYAPYYSSQYNAFWGMAPGKYDRTHRGYPDISLIAADYFVAVDASFIPIYGTSASSPVMGGMTSLANYQRKLKGYSTMGWMNPFLYAYAKEIVLNDIINHDKNNCCGGSGFPTCCLQGFPAEVGWDPVTGLGSLNFTGFLTSALIAAASGPLPPPPPPAVDDDTTTGGGSSHVALTPLGMGLVIAGGVIFVVLIVVGIYFCVFRRAQNKVAPPTAIHSLPPVSAPVVSLVPVQSSAEEVK